MIVAITVSVRYHDKLPFILPNVEHLDAWYFVVHRGDTQTVSVLETERRRNPKINLVFFDGFFTTPGSAFNKSGAVRQAQTLVHALYPESWVILLDSDIVLPPEFSRVVGEATPTLDKKALYGCKRYDYKSPEALERNEGVLYSTSREYFFVGYFQMYFRKDALYEPVSENCGVCDMDFLHKYFKRRSSRHVLPASVKHLGHAAVHWNGRRNDLW